MEKPIPVTKKPIPVAIPIPFTGGESLHSLAELETICQQQRKDIAFLKAEFTKNISERDREIASLRKQNAALKKGPVALPFGK